MSIRKIILAVSILFVIALSSFALMHNYSEDYIYITEDRGNICTYDKNGKLVNSTLAVGEEVEIKVHKTEFDQYKKDAIASNKCFYKLKKY